MNINTHSLLYRWKNRCYSFWKDAISVDKETNMNKKETRNSVARTILKIEIGKYIDKTTKEPVTLATLSADIIGQMNTLLAEHKISRKSIYCTIEMMAFSVFTKDTLASHLQNIHDFCYTRLAK